MTLTCSLLGHAFEPADVEREREERGSEVVTVVRELERCRRCGEERVVSENTEVTTVVEPDEVGLDESGEPLEEPSGPADEPEAEATSGGFGDVVDRSATMDAADGHGEAVGEDEYADRDPAEEDAEILTDDEEAERQPGQWPDEDTDEPWQPESTADEESGDTGEPAESTTATPAPAPDDDRSSSRDDTTDLTVPDGELHCPNCGFRVDAESSFRDGDPCPECGAWLTAERNR